MPKQGRETSIQVRGQNQGESEKGARILPKRKGIWGYSHRLSEDPVEKDAWGVGSQKHWKGGKKVIRAWVGGKKERKERAHNP